MTWITKPCHCYKFWQYCLHQWTKNRQFFSENI